MDMTLLAARLKKARVKAGLTQEELADAANISPHHISVLERGLKVPQIDTLLAISNALGVSVDVLLADYLHHGYVIQSSEISERLAMLGADERAYILAAMDAMITAAEHKQKQ